MIVSLFLVFASEDSSLFFFLWLQSASFADNTTYTTLSRTLKLLISIEDLCSTNKSLRAVWEERRSAILSLVRDIVATKLGAVYYSNET